MEKRGSTQIEIILAFILFVSVVVFAVYFLGSEKNVEKASKLVDNLKDKFIENISVEVRNFPLKINNSLLNQMVVINLGLTDDYNAYVENLSGSTVPSSLDNGILYLNTSGLGNSFKITASEDIENSGENYSGIINGDSYNLGAPLKRTVLSEKKAKELREIYLIDYNLLKISFGISKDFSFSIKNDTTIILNASINMPKDLPLYKSSERREVLRIDGRTEFDWIEVSIW